MLIIHGPLSILAGEVPNEHVGSTSKELFRYPTPRSNFDIMSLNIDLTVIAQKNIAASNCEGFDSLPTGK